MARRSNAGESAAILATQAKEIKSLKDTMAEAKSLGSTLTAGGVTQRMMGLAFREGCIMSAKVEQHSFANTFDGFAAGWYGKDKGMGRTPLDAKSRKTLIGSYQHFTNAGLRWGDAGKPLVTAIMEMTNTPMSTRGAKIGTLLDSDDWKTKAPDADAIAIATGKKKPKGGKREKPKYNGNAVLRALCSNGEAIASKVHEGEFLGWLNGRKNYATLVREFLTNVAAIRQALMEAEKDGSENRKKWKGFIATTTKAATKLPQSGKSN